MEQAGQNKTTVAETSALHFEQKFQARQESQFYTESHGRIIKRKWIWYEGVQTSAQMCLIYNVHPVNSRSNDSLCRSVGTTIPRISAKTRIRPLGYSFSNLNIWSRTVYTHRDDPIKRNNLFPAHVPFTRNLGLPSPGSTCDHETKDKHHRIFVDGRMALDINKMV